MVDECKDMLKFQRRITKKPGQLVRNVMRYEELVAASSSLVLRVRAIVNIPLSD